ncbi:hypothetical protein Tco_0732882 [Tanacetum coccineum]
MKRVRAARAWKKKKAAGDRMKAGEACEGLGRKKKSAWRSNECGEAARGLKKKKALEDRNEAGDAARGLEEEEESAWENRMKRVRAARGLEDKKKARVEIE